MNFSLLQLVGKCITLGFVSFLSLFNIDAYKENEIVVNNANINKDAQIVEVTMNDLNEDGIYPGKMVGYGPDCPGCSYHGYVYCKTENKEVFSLKYDGIYYTDDEYGKVRIVAAALSKFPCGTIIQVQEFGELPFTVIVLDTGSTVRNAWKRGIVIMDLAYEANALAGSDGRTGNNITYEVQRWGW